MKQSLPQSPVLQIGELCYDEAIGYINSYIEDYNCENLTVDISFMNVIDACYVSTLCSTKHYIKYPEGKISWKISSDLIRTLNKDFDLGNSEYC